MPPAFTGPLFPVGCQIGYYYGHGVLRSALLLWRQGRANGKFSNPLACCIHACALVSHGPAGAGWPPATGFAGPLQGAVAILSCAPGYRHRDTGVLTSVGNNGYSWSSTVSGTNGVNLNFNTSWLNPSNTNNRAYGFQVRCLQAFTRTPCPFCYTDRNLWTGCLFPECRRDTGRCRRQSEGEFSSLLILLPGLVMKMRSGRFRRAVNGTAARSGRVPRATATTRRACRVASATTGTVGRRRSAAPTHGSCGSTRRISIPATRTTAPTGVRCGASKYLPGILFFVR